MSQGYCLPGSSCRYWEQLKAPSVTGFAGSTYRQESSGREPSSMAWVRLCRMFQGVHFVQLGFLGILPNTMFCCSNRCIGSLWLNTYHPKRWVERWVEIEKAPIPLHPRTGGTEYSLAALLLSWSHPHNLLLPFLIRIEHKPILPNIQIVVPT